MPFKSQAQRKFMYAQHPDMAKRWEKHTPDKKLPEHVKKSYDLGLATAKQGGWGWPIGAGAVLGATGAGLGAMTGKRYGPLVGLAGGAGLGGVLGGAMSRSTEKKTPKKKRKPKAKAEAKAEPKPEAKPEEATPARPEASNPAVARAAEAETAGELKQAETPSIKLAPATTLNTPIKRPVADINSPEQAREWERATGEDTGEKGAAYKLGFVIGLRKVGATDTDPRLAEQLLELPVMGAEIGGMLGTGAGMLGGGAAGGVGGVGAGALIGMLSGIRAKKKLKRALIGALIGGGAGGIGGAALGGYTGHRVGESYGALAGLAPMMGLAPLAVADELM